MTQIMQAGKIYRMRPVGHQRFTDGYFQDNCFFEGGAFHVGDIAADGAFVYRVNLPDGSPKFPNHVAGHVEGLTLTRIDGTVFELVEQPTSGQVVKIDPNDLQSCGALNTGVEALKKLEARQVAMLDEQELALLREFMDRGRRQGVVVEFDTDTDVQGWAQMNSVRALEILAVANSYVRLRFT